MSQFIVLAALHRDTVLGPLAGILALVWLAVLVLMVASLWVTFSKAGQPGWAAIIPIFNMYVMLEVAGRPGWWLILCFVPFVNLIMIVLPLDIAKRFGQGAMFGLGLLLLPFVFYPILAFGDSTYMTGGAEPRGFEVMPPRQ